MSRSPFPLPHPRPVRRRRPYQRRVGLVGAVVLLIAAIVGGWSHGQTPAHPPGHAPTATQAPAPAAPTATAQADAPPDHYATIGGQPINDRDTVRGIWDTLRRVAHGPPFPYRQDGASFSNREGRLPTRDRGWWHEYTVETPGSPDRGARRLVIGKDGETWYSGDHYRSFVRLALP